MLQLLPLTLLVLTTQANQVQDGLLLEDIIDDLKRSQAGDYQDYLDYPAADYSSLLSSGWGLDPVAAGAAAGPRALHQQDQREQNKHDSRQLKSSMLPAYCDPPNPCPIGYTAQDGCIENFENKADFSQKYQASQSCMCDTEHMFSCPDQMMKQQDPQFALLGLPGVEDVQNPFLAGTKLPIAAKKGIGY